MNPAEPEVIDPLGVLGEIRPRAAGKCSPLTSEYAFSDDKKEVPFNPQLYKNSDMSGSETERDAKAKDFFNAKDPNLVIKHENAQHRMAVYFKARGMSNNEIAEKLGFTVPWVSQILRQPWARLQIVTELQLAGRDAIQTALEGAATDSVYNLIEMANDKNVKDNVRLAANESILDRFCGKAVQRVEVADAGKVSADIKSIDREIEELEREEKRITGGVTKAMTN